MSTALQKAAELFREPGSVVLSPLRVAETLHLELGELAMALGVHRNTLLLSPDNTRVQERLSAFERVFLALIELTPDVTQAALQMRNMPIRTLGRRTLFEAVMTGEEAMALRYLQSISGGQNG